MSTTAQQLGADKPFERGDGLINRVQRYLSDHPEISQEEFLRSALERELAVLEEGGDVPTIAPTPEEIRDHAWIEEGLQRARHQPHGWSSRIRHAFGA